MKTVLWMTGFLVIFAVIQKITWNERIFWFYPLDEALRFGAGIWGPYINRNHFAGYLVMAATLLMTLSRGGIIAFILLYALFRLDHLPHKDHPKQDGPPYNPGRRDYRRCGAGRLGPAERTDTGVVGFLIAVGMALVFFRGVFRCWRRKHAMFGKCIGAGGLASIMAIAVHSFTDFNLHIPANALFFTVISAITYASLFNVNDHQAPDEN